MTLPANLQATKAARDHVAAVLTEWSCDSDTVADALLLVSELVSNVVRHTRSQGVGVRVSATATRVIVSVHEDVVSALPGPDDHLLLSFEGITPMSESVTQVSGRGLKILDEIAAEWGIRRAQGTTSTWFGLTPAEPPPLRVVSPAAAVQVDTLSASVRRLQLLLAITEGLAAAETPDAVGAVITQHLRDHLGAVFTGIALVHDETTMRFLTLDPLPPATSERWLSFAHDSAFPVSAAARDGSAYFHEDLAAMEREFPGLREQAEVAGTSALAHLPLVVDNTAFGTLSVAWADERVIDADTRALLHIVAGATAQALQRTSQLRRPQER